MANLVNVEVKAEKFGNYKKGDIIEGMHPSTAKALGKVIEIIGDHEAPVRRSSRVAVAYKGNTPAESKKIAKERTDAAKKAAEEKEEAEVEAEIAAEEKVEEPKKKNWLGKDKN